MSARAELRATALSARAADDHRDALARVHTYDDKALGTIRRRREATDDTERRHRALLDAREKATQAERERRCQEVVDSHHVGVEIQPFRLHLVMTPAMRLPIRVRRGATTFPFELVWVLATREFPPSSAPTAGTPRGYIAGRERLGCATCLPRPGRTPSVAADPPLEADEEATEPPPTLTRPTQRAGPPTTPTPTRSTRQAGPPARPPPTRRRAPAGQHPPR